MVENQVYLTFRKGGGVKKVKWGLQGRVRRRKIDWEGGDLIKYISPLASKGAPPQAP